jgi:hypothetical protein
MFFQNIIRHILDMSHDILKTFLELCAKTAFKLEADDLGKYYPSTEFNS